MIYFWSVYYLLLFLYCLLIISFSVSWGRKKLFSPFALDPITSTKISVIIALRNEEENIQYLISALSKQTLPPSDFEVILVNDHSTDNTLNNIEKFAEKYSWLQTYSLDENTYGKKEALQLGISKATGELYAFTDGDCLPPETWLSILSLFYTSESNPDFIIGMVDQTANSVLKSAFRLEFLSLILSSAGAAAMGRPILCNGANLAIKASAIKAYSQNVNIPSGDDVFLLHYIKKQGGTIKLLKSKQHIVSTKSPENVRSFIEQRKRWASKSIHYSDFDTIVVALVVFSSNAVLLASLIPGFYQKNLNPIFIGYGLKALFDFVLFKKGSYLYQYKGQLWLLPFISVIYPLYITITALSAIKKPFTWKGRKYS